MECGHLEERLLVLVGEAGGGRVQQCRVDPCIIIIIIIVIFVIIIIIIIFFMITIIIIMIISIIINIFKLVATTHQCSARTHVHSNKQ